MENRILYIVLIPLFLLCSIILIGEAKAANFAFDTDVPKVKLYCKENNIYEPHHYRLRFTKDYVVVHRLGNPGSTWYIHDSYYQDDQITGSKIYTSTSGDKFKIKIFINRVTRQFKFNFLIKDKNSETFGYYSEDAGSCQILKPAF